MTPTGRTTVITATAGATKEQWLNNNDNENSTLKDNLGPTKFKCPALRLGSIELRDLLSRELDEADLVLDEWNYGRETKRAEHHRRVTALAKAGIRLWKENEPDIEEAPEKGGLANRGFRGLGPCVEGVRTLHAAIVLQRHGLWGSRGRPGESGWVWSGCHGPGGTPSPKPGSNLVEWQRSSQVEGKRTCTLRIKKARKSLEINRAWRWKQSSANPSPCRNSLFTGKIQGSLAS